MGRSEPLTSADMQFGLENGSIDTFLASVPGARGQLLGSRVRAEHFLADGAAGGLPVPEALAAFDAREQVMRPDAATYHRMSWQPGTIGVICDAALADGTPVATSPRAILRRQLERLEKAGYTAQVRATTEFLLFEEGPRAAAQAGYADLTPCGGVPGGVAFASARAEGVLRRVRQSMGEAPMPVEWSTGGRAPGQYRISIGLQDALRACDHLAILKNGIKEIVAQEDRSATFMASYADLADNAGHLQVALRGGRSTAVLADRHEDSGLTKFGQAFVAGLLMHAAELALLYAPSVNSYRRLADNAVATSQAVWASADRSVAFRVVGSELSLRIENRIAGSDANPYLAMAGMLAAGMDGFRRQLPVAGMSTPPPSGTSTDLPGSLAEARDAWSGSDWVAETFGEDVRAHYAAIAHREIADGPPTPETDLDWQRRHDFEIA